MNRILLLSSLALMLFTNSFAQADGVTKPTNLAKTEPVSITGGNVKGTSDASCIQSFKGIPFAAPPVGELRWKAPQPVPTWTGIKSCTAFGPSPMQSKPSPFGPWTDEFLFQKNPSVKI